MRRRFVSRVLVSALGAVALGSLGAFGVACTKTTDAPQASAAAVSQEDRTPLMTVDAMIERAKRRDYWPTGNNDWRALTDTDQARLMAKPECADFASTIFPPADADQKTADALGVSVGDLKHDQQALRTDGLIVIKGGQIIWEHYVGPYEGHPEKRHCMWSATKSFTTGLFGALMELSERTKAGETVPGGKLTRSGNVLSLSTRLGDISDAEVLNADPRLAAMTVEDFLTMNTPSPAWNEGYDGNIATSSVVKMLWADGAKDMGGFAAGALLKPAGGEVPGTSFRYSSGNAVILMRALKDLYGAEYDRMPFTALFDRLGMKSTVIERDQKGVYVGSSYAHMTLRDMARFGYAYLNGGYYGGEQVIHPSFIEKARVIGPSMTSTGSTEEELKVEGAFYGLGFWINPNTKLLSEQGVRTFSETFPQKFFPNTPVDVFFAAGHYGQNILMFPKDDLMIVRMSHDNEYFSKLDQMMVKARACYLGASQGGG